jgi:hypothetical protein
LAKFSLQGGSKTSSVVGVRSCQPWYWSLSAVQIPLAVLCTGLVARRLWQQHCQRLAAEDGYHPDELHFGKAELVTYPAIALVAGVIAGLLGIGKVCFVRFIQRRVLTREDTVSSPR